MLPIAEIVLIRNHCRQGRKNNRILNGCKEKKAFKEKFYRNWVWECFFEENIEAPTQITKIKKQLSSSG